MGIKKIDIPQSTAIDTSVLWGGINDNVLATKINEVIDAVNKQQDIIRQIGEWGSKKGECLWCDTLTEFNPKKAQKETFVSIDETLEMGKQDHKIRSTNERLRVELETCYRLILHWQNQLEGCSPNTIGATLYKQMDKQTDYLRQFLTKGGKDE